MKKRIAIVGAGAVGSYLGGHLARTGNDVTLIDPWPEHIETIRQRGLHLSGMRDEETCIVSVPTMHLTEVQSLSRQRPIDIAIISSKSYDTEWCTTLIRPYLSPQGYVVSAQNSINEEIIAGVVGWGRTVGCIVGNNFAVDLYEPGCVRRTMPRDFETKSILVGEVHGRVTPRVKELHALFTPIDGSGVTTNLWGVRWSKLCVNGMRNGVSAATGMSGNERDAHPVIRRLVIRLGGEAIRTGQSLGLDLEHITGIEPNLLRSASEGDATALAEVERHMQKGTGSQARSNLQRPSMAQDIQKGRRTEIGEINGFIVRKAKEAGCAAPAHERIVDIVRKVERGEVTPRPELLFEI
ncbi:MULTISPECIES: ketopantoate reductase family protein [Bradyrhizobium]|nr:MULTISPECIES: 2-dehydropantoate 2-reductase [Bradyrhizobium]MCG2629477.1 2-dehydropantoate 2-reductase [Bradyrhizobium zhengyangense]MCG2644895.1 2-dehydropantoate 2-reductase [Bradyrhizobium zhengyangense]MCG2670991.1 2-dehydropantoate 2-reductase [Bradyrhizobium zhengyangense]MDN4984626.1 2-dehydropantoate 2-reductase [Bradyrhizobium sp. WYCCWR 13022]MDN5002618.1 2-dehydropantoate 2-reductase [Bradyrhizobium sp. WYCCWR 12677]